MDRTDWITDLGWVREARYAEAMEKIVMPYLRSLREDTQINGYGARPIMCARFDAQDARGTVLIVHGFTECIEKYAEVIYALLTQHFSVVIYDQRGHGQSWRAEGLSDASVTHVDAFSDYVIDMERVCAKVLTTMPRPWYVLAHSMGGAVTAFYLEKHAATFDKAVLCSPMIAPNRAGVPYLLTWALCQGAIGLGRGKKRAFVSKPYAGKEDFAHSCATSQARFDWFEEMRAHHPTMQNNGPTYVWTLEALKVTRKLLLPRAVERIACPVRLYMAEKDTSVIPHAEKMFIRRVKDGSFTQVAGSKHEIYRSPDEVIAGWWEDVIGFLGN